MHHRHEVQRSPTDRLAMPGRSPSLMVFALSALMWLAGCHHDVTVVAPDLSQSQLYRLQLVNNQTPPYLVEVFAFGGTRWLSDAVLVPVDLGRGSDPRIFDDRSGIGQTGGTVRDSSAASGRVADVRVFRELDRFNTLVALVRDSVVVNVIRHGDTLFVQRESINPTLAYTDTAMFSGDLLVMRVRRWTHSPSDPPLPAPGTITYNVTNFTLSRMRGN